MKKTCSGYCELDMMRPKIPPHLFDPKFGAKEPEKFFSLGIDYKAPRTGHFHPKLSLKWIQNNTSVLQ